ncbi:hypothetical protein B0H66DRAFT_595219 [Apodospora peruviana]|uniref:Uncharacterized protein n=1 Tax=Apodospora peruviana TaxID=516989 RepID=A0AAE0HVF0_9PEZI|nr:hypothetical protein B0H66DRAFT_595219 [Apodospora peruviana]
MDRFLNLSSATRRSSPDGQYDITTSQPYLSRGQRNNNDEWYDASDVSTTNLTEPNKTTNTVTLITETSGHEDVVESMSRRRPTPKIDIAVSREKPKRLASMTLWPAVIEFVVFQIPSVAVTLVLLVLYIRKFTWNPDVNQLSALLFAARVHESLIVASLFQILYYHIRRALLLPSRNGGGGVSFGFLTSAFQLGSPFYMLSSSFWAPLVKHNQLGGISLSSVAFSVLLIVSFLLTSLAGASSGVVMLPQHGWYDLPLEGNVMAERQNATRSYLPSTEVGMITEKAPFLNFVISPPEAMYPSVIDLTGMAEQCYKAANMEAPPEAASEYPIAMLYTCPFYNWASEGTIATRWLGGGPHLPTVMNITVAKNPDKITATQQQVSYKNLRQGFFDLMSQSYSIAAATCPLAPSLEVVSNEGMRWPGTSGSAVQNPLKLVTKITDDAGNNIPVKQPRVVIQCSEELDPGTKPDGTLTWKFAQGFYPASSLTLDRSALPAEPFGTVGAPFGFIDTSQHPISNNSANINAVSAAVWVRGQRYMFSFNNFTLCLIDARWIDSDTWVMPHDSAVMASHAVSVTDNATLSYSTSTDPPLEITLDWLRMLNATVDGYYMNALMSGPDKEYYAYNLLSSFSEGSALVIDSLAVYLADALSRVPLTRGWWIESNDSTSSGPWNTSRSNNQMAVFDGTALLKQPQLKYAMLGVGYYYEIYAYEFATTATILSWAVLLLHLLVVVIHLGVVVVNKGWSSRAWGQLAEVVALAMKSAPPTAPLLRNTGAGVDGWATWRLKAFVREVETEDGDGRVEMVLREPKEGDSDGGIEAGDEEGGGKRLRRATTADRMYG